MTSNRPRRHAPLSDAEVDAYLDAQRGTEWATLTTIGPDGYPHSITIGYFRVGPTLYFGMRDGTQKVKNAERNPRASAVVANSRAAGGVEGVMIQGDAQIIRDPAERLRLARTSAEQRGVAPADLPAEVPASGVYLALTRRRALTWRYADD